MICVGFAKLSLLECLKGVQQRLNPIPKEDRNP